MSSEANLEPADDEVAFLLSEAACAIADRDLVGAVEALRQLLASAPGHPDGLLQLGLVLAALDRHGEALEPLRRLVRQAPDVAAARVALAESLLALARPEEAGVHFRRALLAEPDHLAALLGAADCLRRLGQASAALELITRALALAPTDADVGLGAGSLLLQLGLPAAAVAPLTLAAGTGAAPARNNLAEALRGAGRLDEAEATVRALVTAVPDYWRAQHTLGAILMQRGDYASAAQALTLAVTQAPGFVPSLHSLARCQLQQGAHAQALALLRQVTELEPGNARALAERGYALQHLERHDEAAAALRQAAERLPQDAEVWGNLAATLIHLKETRAALAAAERSLALDPERVQTYLALCKCHAQLGDRRAAVMHVEHALSRIGDDVTLLLTAGRLLESLKQQAKAKPIYRRVLALDPANVEATSRLIDVTLSLCDWSAYADFTGRLVGELRRRLAAGEDIGIDVFNLQALSVGYDVSQACARTQAAGIARTALLTGAPLPPRAPRPARSRIRIGYALAYTHFHSLPLVLAEIVERHDRERFEVFGYCIEPCDGSPFSLRYRGAFDRFADVPAENARRAAELIRADGIDLLIDTTGLTGVNCLRLMAWRPAPVQVHYLGYSITTGADYIDYLITDETYVPPQWQQHTTERLVYLPDTFMATSRQPVPASSVSRADCGLPQDAMVLANFNHPCKFEPTAFDAWMRILKAVPEAVLWLGAWTDATQGNLRREAAARGVDPSRLVFADIVGRPEHLARLRLADLALDCLNHGGGITSVDALWVGLPVLTLLGDTPSARLGATLVRAAGVPELAVGSLADYVDGAIALANDPAARAALRRRLLDNRDKAALFDQARYQRHLEEALALMWRNYEAGRPPTPIRVMPRDAFPGRPTGS